MAPCNKRLPVSVEGEEEEEVWGEGEKERGGGGAPRGVPCASSCVR